MPNDSKSLFLHPVSRPQSSAGVEIRIGLLVSGLRIGGAYKNLNSYWLYELIRDLFASSTGWVCTFTSRTGFAAVLMSVLPFRGIRIGPLAQVERITFATDVEMAKNLSRRGLYVPKHRTERYEIS